MDVVDTFAAACAADIDVMQRADVASLITDIGVVRSRLDALATACARRLGQLAGGTETLIPEQTLADAGRTTWREAEATVSRAAVLDEVPSMARALHDGTVTAAHVDVLAKATKRLGDDAPSLLGDGEWVTRMAEHQSPERFGRSIARQVRAIEIDLGMTRVQQQRRDTFLRHWIKPETGMTCIYGEFDPERGARLVARLRHHTDRLFHAPPPPDCPTDERRQAHLRALALMELTSPPRVSADQRATGRVELNVIIDLETLRHGPHDATICQNSEGADLSIETVRRLACDADIIPIVLSGASVALDVGRSKRLATNAQRRALAAMYSTCAAPDCDVPFELTTPHHLRDWAKGGGTDLANLAPECDAHHRAVHEGGWRVEMHDLATRTLRWVLPTGEIRYTTPDIRDG